MYTHYAVSVVGLHRFSVGTATKQANKNHQHFLLLLLHEQLSSGLWSVWFGNELIPCYVCPRPFRSTQQSVLPFDTEHCNHIGLTTFTHPPFQSHYPTLASKKLSYLGVKFRMRMCSSATVKSVAQLSKHRSEQHTHIVGSLIYFGKQNWNHGRNLIAIGIPCWFVTAITQSNFLTVKIIIFWLCYDARDTRTSAKNTPCPAISYIFDWTIVILGRSTRVECVCVFYRRTIKLTENGMAWQVGKRVAAAAATIIP